MTTSYLVKSVADIEAYLFVPDDVTKEKQQVMKLPNTVWVVGDIEAANEQLKITQQKYKDSDMWKLHLSQTKLVSVNEDGDETWEACDITKEPPNIHVAYNLFCDVDATHTRVIGTEAALQLLEEHGQHVLAYAGVDAVIEFSFNELGKPALIDPSDVPFLPTPSNT
jgi:hypothetical protein